MDLAKGKWEPADEVSELTVKLSKLKASHQYRFRVKAVNKYGESEPLATKDAITAKNPFG